MTPDPLGPVLAAQPPPFALLYRPESGGPERLDVLVGRMSAAGTLAGVPLPPAAPYPGGARHDALVLVPYRQIAERGYACVDDGEPLLTMTVTRQDTMPLADALRRLPDVPTELTGGHFTPDDESYAATVRDVVADEIGMGEGANFVVKRSYQARIRDYSTRCALSFFRSLVGKETGAYWVYLVHTGTRTFVGASPERHVSLGDGVAVMNPISGTYRYPPSGPALGELLEFLADRKETDELYMVLDEELKMMSRICDGGSRAVGPYLKEMARLAHTEYLIEGRSSRDPRDILHETLFAPTVTGSPLESACRVIEKYEPAGRGYYSGVVALIGRDGRGARTMDSSILIRTADIDAEGHIDIGVGATLVRHSDPLSEVAETKAKAGGLLAALEGGRQPSLADHPSVREALAGRNATISGFWLAGGAADGAAPPAPALAGLKVGVVDAEDTFTSMLDEQLRSLGLSVRVTRYDEDHSFADHDLVVMGPGPGDPRDGGHPKIAFLRAAVDALLDGGRPFLAVCLSHQVLSSLLGLDLVRREVPNQGTQREIDLFGERETVGFYNTFAARCHEDKAELPRAGLVEVSRDRHTGEVHALRARRFASVQFHAESVLTRNGPRILSRLLTDLLGA